MPTPPASGLYGSLRANHDCHITEVNDTLCAWLGYAPAELIDRRFDTLLNGAGRLYFEAQCLPNLEINHLIEEVYLTLRTKDDNQVPVLINASHEIIDGKATFEMAFVRISRRARLEEELLRTKKLAVQSDQAKSRFLGMITHELRTPLQSISLSVDLLLEKSLGTLAPTQLELLEICQEAGSNLSHLINDILDFTSLQSGKVNIQPETVSATECLERSAILLKRRTEEVGISFRTDFPTSDHHLVGDPRRIQQILLNLVTNAIKFTPPGGQITSRVVIDDHFASIEVEDTGSGIQEDDLNRIFEAFVQVGASESKAKGIGLGLAISRDLAHAMQGKLRVRSTPEVGSTFSLSLPLASSTARPSV